jgi:hypothetical protein
MLKFPKIRPTNKYPSPQLSSFGCVQSVSSGPNVIGHICGYSTLTPPLGTNSPFSWSNLRNHLPISIGKRSTTSSSAGISFNGIRFTFSSATYRVDVSSTLHHISFHQQEGRSHAQNIVERLTPPTTQCINAINADPLLMHPTVRVPTIYHSKIPAHAMPEDLTNMILHNRIFRLYSILVKPALWRGRRGVIPAQILQERTVSVRVRQSGGKGHDVGFEQVDVEIVVLEKVLR